MNIQTINSVSLDVAKVEAPAIFATSPAPNIKSKNYHFTPTIEVINHLQDLGFVLSSAKQSLSKNNLKRSFGSHIVKFQHPDLTMGDEGRPEIVMINSHNGTKKVQFEMGIFRLVCENGLIVKSRDMGSFSEKHTRYTFPEIKNLIEGKVEELHKVVSKINVWNMREMTEKERFNFALNAIAVRYDDSRMPNEEEIRNILRPVRNEDQNPTLWNTFNVLQEKLTKGGYIMGKKTSRAIKNPMEDLRINKGLWELADSYVQ